MTKWQPVVVTATIIGEVGEVLPVGLSWIIRLTCSAEPELHNASYQFTGFGWEAARTADEFAEEHRAKHAASEER